MEQEVNELLLKGYKAAEYQYKIGHKEAGDLVIGLTSQLALHLIKTWNLNGKVICNHCNRESKIAEERDNIRDYGMCYTCEKLLAEYGDESLEGSEDELVN